MAGYLAGKAFSRACHECSPNLENYIRTEEFDLQTKTLILRVHNSAVSDEFQYIRDIVLKKTNELLHNISINIKKHSVNRKIPVLPEIRAFRYTVGNVFKLPDFKAWHTRPKRVRPKARPTLPPSPDVGLEIGRVLDPELRLSLARLYARVINPKDSED